MWDHTNVEGPARVEYAVRTAACLGALGYSPHEVVSIVAIQLGVGHQAVAEMLTARGAGSFAAA